jgi:hypothetical protein
MEMLNITVKNITFRALILISVVCLFHACAPVYIPNVINTPMLSNRGEFHANLNTGTSGFDPQLSFAVTDHIGVMLNGSFANRNPDSTSSHHQHQFCEFGIGYFTRFERIGRFETYMGYGRGRINAFYDCLFWKSFSNVTYNRVFVQPAIGISSRWFDGSLAIRMAYVDISQKDYRTDGFFMEPALTLKLGYDYFKIVTQWGYSFPADRYVRFDYEPFMFSIGVQIALGRKNIPSGKMAGENTDQ